MAVSSLQKRYTDLVTMGDKLPTENAIQTPEGFDIEGINKMLPAEGFQESEKPSQQKNRQEEPPQETHQTQEHPPEESPPIERPESRPGDTHSVGGKNTEPPTQSPTEPLINRSALTLALFGWDTVSDGTAGLVGCGACFRRLGLWLYKPKDNGDVTVYNYLDVIAEHMEYCPWVSGQAQSGTGKPTEKPENLRNGWELLAQAIRVKHRRTVRSTASMDTLRACAETASINEPAVDEETKKASDREWWSKIRRMKLMLNVKGPKGHKSTGSR